MESKRDFPRGPISGARILPAWCLSHMLPAPPTPSLAPRFPFQPPGRFDQTLTVCDRALSALPLTILGLESSSLPC